ncbi:methyl-accepting chemotaxis protein, partial [Variovorax sp.]|uniref:methyl-accepting chemotaxis protein n=1 Tax=Variovorax sp. TaxID=1871043 RepID=UPI002D5854DA
MEEIVESVKRVTDIMGEIASASQEQTSGIEQINQAITQMDQVTQQNAALVEEAAAAAASLQDQAGSLVQSVSVFRIGGDDAAAQVIAQARGAGRASASATAPAPGRSRPANGGKSHAPAEDRPEATAAARRGAALATAEPSGDWTEF